MKAVLLENLTVSQLVKKFLASYGTEGVWPCSQPLNGCPCLEA